MSKDKMMRVTAEVTWTLIHNDILNGQFMDAQERFMVFFNSIVAEPDRELMPVEWYQSELSKADQQVIDLHRQLQELQDAARPLGANGEYSDVQHSDPPSACNTTSSDYADAQKGHFEKEFDQRFNPNRANSPQLETSPSEGCGSAEKMKSAEEWDESMWEPNWERVDFIRAVQQDAIQSAAAKNVLTDVEVLARKLSDNKISVYGDPEKYWEFFGHHHRETAVEVMGALRGLMLTEKEVSDKARRQALEEAAERLEKLSNDLHNQGDYVWAKYKMIAATDVRALIDAGENP